MRRAIAWLVIVGAVVVACGAPARPAVDVRPSSAATGDASRGGNRLVIVVVEPAGKDTYLMLVRETRTGACVLVHVSDRAYAAYSSQAVVPKEACA